MKSRVDEVPALWVMTTTVNAAQFNRIRLALLRLGEPLRLALPSLRGMNLLLSREAWVCVDATLDDLPVIAWLAFPADRSGLHAPVPCELRYYHAHAGLIARAVLEEGVAILEQRMATRGDGDAARPSPLSPNDETPV